MEGLEGVIRVENHNAVNLTRFPGLRKAEKLHLGDVFTGDGLPHHPATPSYEPFQVQGGVMEEETLQKIIAGLIASAQNIGDAAARHG